MFFYVVMGVLFAVYALDLLFLVVSAMIAKAREAPPPQFDTDHIKKVYKLDQGRTLQEAFPKVLIQLPMFNEEAHCDLIIERCCQIKWPRDRVLIQVLDDSTKENVRQKVDTAAAVAVECGYPVTVLRRDNRQGYKAGALVEGLNRTEGQGYEFVAIFDADFDPPSDFLYQCIHHMVENESLAFVQTRWCYSNADDSFLTWAQKINLNFHFDIEQRARSYLGWFFNFNGTAGVWRIRSIHDAGGWQSDTVVEDMDLSLRCYLKGWKGIYLDHVHNPNELPSTLSSYKTQQFRWLCGPMQILSKCFKIIWNSADQLSLLKRMNCYWFFFRYILFGTVTVAVLLVPPVAMWLDKWEWKGPQIFFLVAVNFALAVYLYITPFSIAYLFFSVAIGYFKLWAMVGGLLGTKKSTTWKVTQKYGKKEGSFWRSFHRPYTLELILALYYAGMGAGAFYIYNYMMFGYCVVMSLCFLSISFGDYWM